VLFKIGELDFVFGWG